jgi:hypothetical protein
MLASPPSTELESDIARFGNPDSVTKHQALAVGFQQVVHPGQPSETEVATQTAKSGARAEHT